AAADRGASGRQVSRQQRPLRAGERPVGDFAPKSPQPASQRTADIGRQNPSDVGMGREDRNLSAYVVGSPEQVRMDRGAGADGSQIEPRWKTITVGEHNRTASGADTVYADQKVGLM